MKVKELIKILEQIEDKEIIVSLRCVGDGFINIESMYTERKSFGNVLMLSDCGSPYAIKYINTKVK